MEGGASTKSTAFPGINQVPLPLEKRKKEAVSEKKGKSGPFRSAVSRGEKKPPL